MMRMLSLPSPLGSLGDQVAPADQVVRRGAEGKHPVDEASATMAKFAQQADGFHPAEGLLHELPFALAEGVTGVAHGTIVDGAAAAAIHRRRDVRRDAHLP